MSAALPPIEPATEPSGAERGAVTEPRVYALRVLYVLCFVLPVIVYGAVGISRYQQTRAEAEVRLDRALRIAREHALKVLDTNQIMLERVLDVVGTEENDATLERGKALHDQLDAMTRDLPQIHTLSILGADGRTLVTDRVWPATPDIDLSDRASFRWHEERRGGTYLSEPLRGRVTGTVFFDMSRGRYAADGRFLGTVAISLLPSYFEGFHGDLGADEPGLAVTMFREDGAIYTRWPKLDGRPTSLSAGSPVLQRIRAGQDSGQAHGVSSVDGRERLLLYAKVGGYPVYLGTGLDSREITRRWLAEMGWLLAFGLPPLIGLLVVARTALKRTRDALDTAKRLSEETTTRRRVEEALLQSQKLEALGRLTGGVAHDFNNALMVISNNVFLLKRAHPAANGRQLASIGRAVDSATRLTRQLLAFSRRQALVPEHVRLQDRLPQLRDLLAPVMGRQIELSIDAAPDVEAVLVDWAEIELAVINLAINARDAMPQGGHFLISARNAVVAELPPTLNPPMVVVEGVDSGDGIPGDILDKVFEPFFTTKPVGQGTGLGLSQIYGMCVRAGGLATIESQLGVGTTVRMFFPAQPGVVLEEPDPSSGFNRQLGKHLLLAEDNDDVAEALVPVLQAIGCTVVRVDSGDKAAQWLASQIELPDLLLSDVVMPGAMDGLALAQHVRANYPGLKIILMSGYAEQLDAISKQGFEILPKPCAPDVLSASIMRATS